MGAEKKAIVIFPWNLPPVSPTRIFINRMLQAQLGQQVNRGRYYSGSGQANLLRRASGLPTVSLRSPYSLPTVFGLPTATWGVCGAKWPAGRHVYESDMVMVGSASIDTWPGRGRRRHGSWSSIASQLSPQLWLFKVHLSSLSSLAGSCGPRRMTEATDRNRFIWRRIQTGCDVRVTQSSTMEAAYTGAQPGSTSEERLIQRTWKCSALECATWVHSSTELSSLNVAFSDFFIVVKTKHLFSGVFTWFGCENQTQIIRILIIYY